MQGAAPANFLLASPRPPRRIHDEKETTVYKRALEVQYQLKLKVSEAEACRHRLAVEVPGGAVGGSNERGL